ncbi:IS3 family transposase [Marinitoga lauensis]|uniref:IS3 family transposase n=1 Tax=Marinitoga lauensis TaxID=2201189 RepID=UPI0014044E85
MIILSHFFYKTLGSKKLSAIFRQKYNIIINHKKIHRLRKELNLIRNYHYPPKHPRKRPKKTMILLNQINIGNLILNLFLLLFNMNLLNLLILIILMMFIIIIFHIFIFIII